MSIWSAASPTTGLIRFAAIAASILAFPQLAGAQSAYPGTLACDGVPGVIAPIRVAVTLAVDGTRASYQFRTDPGVTEAGQGALVGRQLTLTGEARGRYAAHYSGEIGGRGGFLTGSHTGRTGGKSFRRSCQIALGDGRG